MSKHNWKPTTNTLAAWKCNRCGSVGFSPHPLPKDGCSATPTVVQGADGQLATPVDAPAQGHEAITGDEEER